MMNIDYLELEFHTSLVLDRNEHCLGYIIKSGYQQIILLGYDHITLNPDDYNYSGGVLEEFV